MGGENFQQRYYQDGQGRVCRAKYPENGGSGCVRLGPSVGVLLFRAVLRAALRSLCCSCNGIAYVLALRCVRYSAY